MSGPSHVTLRVQRQAAPDAPRYWQSFVVARDEVVTVADALDAINRDPRSEGKRVAPIAWEGSCRYPECGGCAMLIGGRAALACGTRVDEAAGRRGVITLAPLSKFPLRRDLWVDRGRMQRDLLRLRAFAVEPDGDELAAESDARRALRRALARCTQCAVCLEACPEVRRGAVFVGPAAIGQAHEARLVSPRGGDERVEALMRPGGIDECGHAENCIQVCPESVPLGEALAPAFRDVTRRWLRELFGRR